MKLIDAPLKVLLNRKLSTGKTPDKILKVSKTKARFYYYRNGTYEGCVVRNAAYFADEPVKLSRAKLPKIKTLVEDF